MRRKLIAEFPFTDNSVSAFIFEFIVLVNSPVDKEMNKLGKNHAQLVFGRNVQVTALLKGNKFPPS